MLKLIRRVADRFNADPHLSMDKAGVNRVFLAERPQPPTPMRAKGGWSPDNDGPRNPPKGPSCIPARPA